MIRNGYVAVFGGTEYEASPAPDGTIRLYGSAPAEGFEEIASGRHRRVVAADEITGLRYVCTVCAWRGSRFLVIGEHGDWLRVERLDTDEALADKLGLDRFDSGVHQGWAPRAEVTDLVEEFIDS